MRLARLCVSYLSVDESAWYRLSFSPRWKRLNQINPLRAILVQTFLSAVKNTTPPKRDPSEQGGICLKQFGKLRSAFLAISNRHLESSPTANTDAAPINMQYAAPAAH